MRRPNVQVMAAVRGPRRAPLLQLAKTAVATIGAWLVAGLMIPDGPPPVFAAIAALLVVQPSLSQSWLKGIERCAGVIVGVVVASLIAWGVPDPTWSMPLAVIAGLAVAWLVRLTAGTTNQVAISALLVIAMGATTPSYAFDRAVETIVGAVIGFIVNLALVPPVAVAPARRSVDALADELAASLERLADALLAPQAPAKREELLLTARLLRPMRDAAKTALSAAHDSLSLNPRGGRHRGAVDDIQALYDRIDPVVTQTVGMTRAFYDRYSDQLAADGTVHEIADQMRRSAHDVRFLSRRAVADPADPPTTTIPVLTRPLRIAAPTGTNWVLVGSLLEDLRRINDELTEETP
ncbi:FUSC family protein [Microbacterium indicum]|uniref:FUSC family protein n=1 Tax=Microbacterium indicum TaxID=358100 RepID=UPI000413EE92|nr:FUSC family protein [Microbacterium indicum]